MHIGIVAVSPEGAALCYRQISRQAARLVEGGRSPRITLHGEPFGDYLQALKAQDWIRVGELLRRSAEALARAGAEVCFSPDNAVQHGVHLAEVGSPVPWLMMTDLVAKRVEADGRKTVGIIGTKMVTSGSTYQTHLGLRGVRVLAPEPAEAEALDGIIFGELIYGKILPASQKRVLGIIKELAGRGCEGVILGCSEAPLLVTPENSPIPVYDAADILSEGAIRHALSG